MTSIGSGAFNGCELRTVISKQTDPTSFSSAFSDATYTHATLYVPEGTFWNYVYKSNWGTFIHMKEMANETSGVRAETCYMLADEQGCNYSVWDEDTKQLKNIDYTHNLDEEAAGTYWQVKTSGNRCTLLNIGANQYGSLDAQGNMTLSTTPVEMDIEDNNGSISINGRARMLVLSQNADITPVTAITTSTSNRPNDGKYLENGRIVIRKDGRTYNVSGVQKN